MLGDKTELLTSFCEPSIGSDPSCFSNQQSIACYREGEGENVISVTAECLPEDKKLML